MQFDHVLSALQGCMPMIIGSVSGVARGGGGGGGSKVLKNEFI